MRKARIIFLVVFLALSMNAFATHLTEPNKGGLDHTVSLNLNSEKEHEVGFSGTAVSAWANSPTPVITDDSNLALVFKENEIEATASNPVHVYWKVVDSSDLFIKLYINGALSNSDSKNIDWYVSWGDGDNEYVGKKSDTAKYGSDNAEVILMKDNSKVSAVSSKELTISTYKIGTTEDLQGTFTGTITLQLINS